jgi:UPF0755 protein
MRLLRTIFLGITLSVFLSLMYLGTAPSGPFGVTENEQTLEIIIPSASSLSTIAQLCTKEGELSYPYGFMLRVLLMDKGSKLQAGEYEITPHMPMDALITKLVKGDVIKRNIAVVEGATVGDVIALLRENKLLSGEIGTLPEEGMLLPATYPYKRGEKRADLLTRMRNSMEKELTALWENRPQTTKTQSYPLKTKEDVLILASLIEKETNTVLAEQPYVAGVFLNRLKLGMKLQCDPTVIYALLKRDSPKDSPKGKLNRSLTRDDLVFDSPYNTYRYSGLPPSPICCPRKEAIQAVLAFHDHKDLYFVADGKGGHVFSKTLDEHNLHVKKWRESQKKKKDE